MKGVPVARRITGSGKDAGRNEAFGPCRTPVRSARYIFSLTDPNAISGFVAAIFARTASLSVFSPARRGAAKAQGMPMSFSRNCFGPRVQVSVATTATLAVAWKS